MSKTYLLPIKILLLLACVVGVYVYITSSVTDEKRSLPRAC